MPKGLTVTHIPTFASRLWFWYANAIGVAAIAFGISLGVLQMFSQEGPVIVLTEGPYGITTKVPFKGVVRYTISTKRNASCPGQVVTSFFSLNRPGPNSTVVLRRPVIASEIKERNDVAVEIDLPESVYPGQWIYQSAVDSRCPTFQRVDPIAKFDLEVTPP